MVNLATYDYGRKKLKIEKEKIIISTPVRKREELPKTNGAEKQPLTRLSKAET